MLGAPCGVRAVDDDLAVKDALHSAVECCLTSLTRSGIRDVSKVARVVIYIPEQLQYIDHQIVVEGDVVLITVIVTQRPVLTPSAAALLCIANHL